MGWMKIYIVTKKADDTVGEVLCESEKMARDYVKTRENEDFINGTYEPDSYRIEEKWEEVK